MTDEEKRKIQLERTSLAAEYGNDFDSIQKYCIEKIIKRNLNIKSTIIGRLYDITRDGKGFLTLHRDIYRLGS